VLDKIDKYCRSLEVSLTMNIALFQSQFCGLILVASYPDFYHEKESIPNMKIR
jgi:hypothetical protein